MERIGIDTHGYDMPPEGEELTEAQTDRLGEIEEALASLVKEYKAICGELPYIPGFQEVGK